MSADHHTRALTDRQRAVLDHIRSSIAAQGFAPSMREIGRAVGLAGAGAVSYQLDELVRKGYLRRTPGAARSLVLLDPAGRL